jgi:dUTP pyrophosphatase
MTVGYKIYRKTKDVPLPKKMSEGASGFDLIALIDQKLYLPLMKSVKIPTGVFLALEPGWEAQVRPRSSFNAKGILCGFGTIDSDYRGEIFVTLTNLTPELQEILPGDRIAQLVFAQVPPLTCTEVESLEALGTTERGSSGFGSTGR